MNHFSYQHGELHAEAVSLSRLADIVGTPFYCYSTATLERHFNVLRQATLDLDPVICFAIKANGNLAVIRTLAALGAGADVVSEGEMRRALVAGVPAGKIVFSGVGKTDAELAFAIDQGILQINVESEPELEALNAIAVAKGKKIDVALRVNPDVDAHTHAKITTGTKGNKFGVDWPKAPKLLRHAQSLAGVNLVGIAAHIGSQLTELQPFQDAFARLKDLVLSLRGEGIEIARLDLGGGLGVPYDDQPPPSPEDYARIVRQTLGNLGCRLIMEPGRMLVGNAGILVSRVIYMKQGEDRRFVICDAAMNDLVRPAMYDAYHGILPIKQPPAGVAMAPWDVVGPICESGDTFARQRPLPPLNRGDLIAFSTAGAYGASMSSTYNSRRLVPEVLVRDQEFAIVRRRPTYDEALSLEQIPDWFEPEAKD